MSSDESQLVQLRASGPTVIDAAMSLTEIARAICRQWLTTLLQHTAATRRGGDVEALHEMRVAARRMEAAIRLFRHYLPEWTLESGGALRSLGQALGATRDFDVQLGFFRNHLVQLSATERRLLEPLESRLEAGRTRAHDHLLKILEAPATQQWLSRWIAFLSASPEIAAHSAAPPTLFALAAIRQRYKRVRRAAEELTAKSSAADYHEVRSRVKRLRYTLEAFTPLCGSSAAKFLRALVRVQDLLGDYQDAEVRARRLAALAKRRSRPLPGATLLFMGRILERDAHQGRKVRRRFPKVYRGVRGRPWKRLRHSLIASQNEAVAAIPRLIDAGESARARM